MSLRAEVTLANQEAAFVVIGVDYVNQRLFFVLDFLFDSD